MNISTPSHNSFQGRTVGDTQELPVLGKSCQHKLVQVLCPAKNSPFALLAPTTATTTANLPCPQPVISSHLTPTQIHPAPTLSLQVLMTPEPPTQLYIKTPTILNPYQTQTQPKHLTQTACNRPPVQT